MSYVVAPQGSYAYTVSHVNNILWDDTHLCHAHALTPDEAEQFGAGGAYGGGGGGGAWDGSGGTGGSGGLRIIWGAGRSYPSTNTADV